MFVHVDLGAYVAGVSTSERLADKALAMHQQPVTNLLQGGLSRSLARVLPKGPGVCVCVCACVPLCVCVCE